MDLIQESQWLFNTLLACISIITLHTSMEYLEKYNISYYPIIKNAIYSISGVLFLIILLMPISNVTKAYDSNIDYVLGLIIGVVIVIVFTLPQLKSDNYK